jgi:hypothetical protein
MATDFGNRLPRHVGYERLAIILEKNKEYDQAIRTCEAAKLGGWSGDWDRRIDRCAARMAKATGP